MGDDVARDGIIEGVVERSIGEEVDVANVEKSDRGELNCLDGRQGIDENAGGLDTEKRGSEERTKTPLAEEERTEKGVVQQKGVVQPEDDGVFGIWAIRVANWQGRQRFEVKWLRRPVRHRAEDGIIGNKARIVEAWRRTTPKLKSRRGMGNLTHRIVWGRNRLRSGSMVETPTRRGDAIRKRQVQRGAGSDRSTLAQRICSEAGLHHMHEKVAQERWKLRPDHRIRLQ